MESIAPRFEREFVAVLSVGLDVRQRNIAAVQMS